MARFYRVTERNTGKEAIELAAALGKHLRKEGFPSATTVEAETRGMDTVYVVFSTATPRQMDEFHNVINADPVRFAVKDKSRDIDPETARIFEKARRSFNKDQKKEIAARKRRQMNRRR